MSKQTSTRILWIAVAVILIAAVADLVLGNTTSGIIGLAVAVVFFTIAAGQRNRTG